MPDAQLVLQPRDRTMRQIYFCFGYLQREGTGWAGLGLHYSKQREQTGEAKAEESSTNRMKKQRIKKEAGRL